MLPITTSTSDELFSRITIDDFESTMKFQNKGLFIDFCSLRLQRCDEVAGDRLTVCEQKLL